MIRLGIIDFDSSHCVEFSRRLNHVNISEDQWVDGARVTLGWTGPSAISPEYIDSSQKELTEKIGVRLVDKPQDMIGQVDGVLIESNDGTVHLERAAPFLAAGLPVFIDKPFTCSLDHAKSLADLAIRNNAPLLTASSLRYALEVQDVKERTNETGAVIGVHTHSPCSLHPRNPGLFHYGIHALETLYALMGPGCEAVWTVWRKEAEVVVGVWQGGRMGSIRGIRRGTWGFGFTAYCEKQVVHAVIETDYIYRELLKNIVTMFETGQSSHEISESVEIVAFVEAAILSGSNGGVRIPLETT